MVVLAVRTYECLLLHLSDTQKKCCGEGYVPLVVVLVVVVVLVAVVLVVVLVVVVLGVVVVVL
jgi:hypothetical protein